MSIYKQDTSLPFCTYLTVYSGNKLPPFYIGSKDIQSILNGYHGSVASQKYIKVWKSELKENPHLFKTIILTYHETFQMASEKEIYFQRKMKVLKNPTIYLNRNIGGVNFYCSGHTEKTKQKMRKPKNFSNRKGISFGKTLSDEHKSKLFANRKSKSQSKELIDKRSNSKSRYWQIKYPDGHIEVIKNLAKFCRENSLYESSMLNGNSKGYSATKFISVCP